MVTVVFGLGKFFKNHKSDIERYISGDKVIFADNNADLIGLFEGKKVYNANELIELKFDRILITSIYESEIKKQLMELGIPRNKIVTKTRFISNTERGHIEIFESETGLLEWDTEKKKILIITTSLGYNGASWAIIYAAIALRDKGYYVCIATGGWIERDFIHVVNERGFDLLVFNSFPYLGGLDFNVINRFDVIFANVFQSMPCVYSCVGRKPVFWWIHENPGSDYEDLYKSTLNSHDDIEDFSWMQQVSIAAVSNEAKKGLERYFPDATDIIMPYGIEDYKVHYDKNSNTVKFAVIGGITYRKAQDVFISAAIRLLRDYPDKCEFLIIGGYSDTSDYYKSLVDMIGEVKHICFLGVKTREEINELFEEIDVSVCSSRSECLQVVTTEGLMHEKLCITTNASGMTKYIKDGENGFVFESGNVDSLYLKMKWIVDHFDDKKTMDKIRHNGRKTYENYFSIEVFGERLDKEMKKLLRNRTDS